MSVINPVLIVISDTLYTYFVTFLKIYLEQELWHEFSLDVATPCKFDPNVAIVIGANCLFFAVLSDSYAGKSIFVVIGIACTLISCSLAFTSFIFPDVSSFIFLATVAICLHTSITPVKTSLILEQIPREDNKLKSYLFFMCYSKILVRITAAIKYEPRETFLIGLVTMLVYYSVFIFYVEDKIYSEPVYVGFPWKWIKCYYYALKGLKNRSSVQNQTRKVVIGRLINESRKQNKTCRLLCPLNEVIVSKEVGYLVVLDNWISNAKDESSDYIILQTIKFNKLLPMVFLSCCFSQLTYVILVLTKSEMEISHIKKEFFVDFEIETLFQAFQAVLYPLAEFALVPIFSRLVRKPSRIILIGYIFLLISAFLTLFVNFTLVEEFMEPYRQIRWFNDNEDPVIINNGNEIIHISPYDVNFSKPHYQSKRTHVKLEILDRVSYHYLNPIIKGSVSYLVSSFIELNTPLDPLQQDVDIEYKAVIYVVTRTKENFTLSFEQLGEEITTVPVWSGYKPILKFYPGFYKIKLAEDQSVLYSWLYVGCLYSLFIHKNNYTYYTKITQVEGPMPIRFRHLMPQLLLLGLAHSIVTVQVYTVIYMMSPVKIRTTVLALQFFLNMFAISILGTETIEKILHSHYLFLTIYVFLNTFIFIILCKIIVSTNVKKTF